MKLIDACLVDQDDWIYYVADSKQRLEHNNIAILDGCVSWGEVSTDWMHGLGVWYDRFGFWEMMVDIFQLSSVLKMFLVSVCWFQVDKDIVVQQNHEVVAVSHSRTVTWAARKNDVDSDL